MNDVVVIFGIQTPELLNDDVDAIADQHQTYESARRLIFALTSSKGGRVIGQIHGNEIVTIPVEQAEVIREIHSRIRDELNIPCSVGVGEDADQATQALEYGQKNAPDSIKVYTKEMTEEESLGTKPQDVAEGEQDRIAKSQNYVPVSDEEKLKIALILKTMKKNKPLFDQLMQEAPDVYASVVSVAQSLAVMLQEDKRSREEHVAEMIGKINDHLNRHTQRAAGKQGKQIQKEIDKKYKEKSKRDQENDKSIAKISTEKRKDRLKDAREYAAKTGHHSPEFLAKLLSAFKG